MLSVQLPHSPAQNEFRFICYIYTFSFLLFYGKIRKNIMEMIRMLVNQSVDNYDRTTETYIVAYLDILGITNRIKAKDENKLAMNKLYNFYTHSMQTTKMIQIEENKDIQFKIFSDNVIIAKRVSKDKEQRMKDIRSLLMCTGHFQELAASDSVGWMLRGGITIGQLFIDDVMVWGDALVKAYYLEDKVATYPRVIIDNIVVQEIIGNELLKEYLRMDFDNLYFLNYLNDCYFCGQMLMEGFEIMKAEVNNKFDEKTYQKFCWHMNFINSELDRKNQKKDKKYRLFMG